MLELDNSIIEALKVRTSPVVITALMASIGLIAATILTLLIFPIIFWIFNKNKFQEIV